MTLIIGTLLAVAIVAIVCALARIADRADADEARAIAERRREQRAGDWDWPKR